MNITTTRSQGVKDVLSLVGLAVAVLAGAWLINLFLFRSFSVSGPSMEPTLYTGDRLIVNRVPVTIAHVSGNSYVPKRGEVIVFENPLFVAGMHDEFIVKRVIAFPGERVTVKDGQLRVYNKAHPEGMGVDSGYHEKDGSGPTSPTDGLVDKIIPDGQLFVCGDHRQEGYSMDSRNQLGTIPYDNVIGPVALRIFPLTKIRTFN